LPGPPAAEPDDASRRRPFSPAAGDACGGSFAGGGDGPAAAAEPGPSEEGVGAGTRGGGGGFVTW